MSRANWVRSNRRLIVAILVLAGGTAALSAGIMRPAPFPFPFPGSAADWQCSRTAGVLTVCTPAPGRPGFDSSQKVPHGPRKV
jgi:hypothetical protein